MEKSNIKRLDSFDVLFENHPLPMWIYDLATLSFIEVNDAAIVTYGYSRKEFLSMTIKDIRPKDDMELLFKNLEKERPSYENTFWRHKKKNGEIIFVEITSHTIDYNEKQAVLVIARDITIEKKNEEELKKLSKAVEQGPASVIITDVNGNIDYTNKKFSEICGYSREEVIGKNPLILRSSNKNEEIYKEMWTTIKAGNEWKGELLNKKKNGELFWNYAYISPLKNNKGEITHFVFINEDISETKKLLQDLVEAKEKAEVANNLKDTFIANISHEIRTPLNGLLGMVSMLKETFDEYITHEEEIYFEGIDLSGKRLIRTVDMILNYSRLRTGEYPIQKKKLYLDKIIGDLVSEYIISARTKELEFYYTNKAGNSIINGDGYSITEAISNLVDNSIKYTHKGRIDIFLYEKKGKIVLEIKDSGIGMSEEYLKKMFEPYSQEETGYGRAYEGVGLGLSLVKNFLNLNNATLDVKSEKNIGSVFTIGFEKS